MFNRGRRVYCDVATVVGMVADGMGEEEILKAYPNLEREDVREALRYAAEAVRGRGSRPFEAPSLACGPSWAARSIGEAPW